MRPEKIPVKKLERLFAQATKKQTAEVWKPRFLTLKIEMLEKDPLSYRQYGPYWWLLKQAIIHFEPERLGEYLDEEWFGYLDYGSEELNLCAAFAYAEDQSARLAYSYSETHSVDDLDTGDRLAYVIYDPDLEKLCDFLGYLKAPFIDNMVAGNGAF
jgi:hypothetical protein